MLNDEQISSLKKQVMSIKIIHFALCFGVLLFLLVGLYQVFIIKISPEMDPQKIRLFQAISVIIFVVCMLAGYVFFRKKMVYAGKLTNLFHKLQAYGFALMIKMAFLEASALISIVILMLLADRVTIIMILLSLFVMAINFPSFKKIAVDLELNGEEKMVLGVKE